MWPLTAAIFSITLATRLFLFSRCTPTTLIKFHRLLTQLPFYFINALSHKILQYEFINPELNPICTNHWRIQLHFEYISDNNKKNQKSFWTRCRKYHSRFVVVSMEPKTVVSQRPTTRTQNILISNFYL